MKQVNQEMFMKLIYKILQGGYMVSLMKNATYPAISVVFHIYNIWLEE